MCSRALKLTNLLQRKPPDSNCDTSSKHRHDILFHQNGARMLAWKQPERLMGRPAAAAPGPRPLPVAPSAPSNAQPSTAERGRKRSSPQGHGPKRLTGGSLGGSCRDLRGCCSGFTAGPLADAVCSACPAGRGEKAGCHGGANQEMVSSKRANTPMIMAHQGPGASGA